MKVVFALLADYINVTREGKLNILGVFDTLYANAFPTQHPLMQLVIRLEASIVEVGNPINVEVRLIDPDGKRLFSLNGDIVPPAGRAGEPIHMNHVMVFNNVAFERAGNHAFSILVNREERWSVPISIIPRPQQPPS